MALLLTDHDLHRCLPMQDAVAAIEGALAERRAGTMVSPPRTSWDIGTSGFTITPGGFLTSQMLGMRVYLPGGKASDQLTMVWGLEDRRLRGIILGSDLGAIRTGAIGGVAVKAMSLPDAQRVGIVGAGLQSRTQLSAIRVVRPNISEVIVFRRDAGRRTEVARRWSEEFGIQVRPAESARETVEEADIIVLATTSSTPVIEGRWVAPGAHVNSLGPKERGHSEIGRDLLDTADWLVSDFPEQYRGEPDFLLHGSPRLSELRDLAQFEVDHPARTKALRSVFLSHGLAGTEVAVAQKALENAERAGVGQPIDLSRD